MQMPFRINWTFKAGSSVGLRCCEIGLCESRITPRRKCCQASPGRSIWLWAVRGCLARRGCRRRQRSRCSATRPSGWTPTTPRIRAERRRKHAQCTEKHDSNAHPPHFRLSRKFLAKRSRAYPSANRVWPKGQEFVHVAKNDVPIAKGASSHLDGILPSGASYAFQNVMIPSEACAPSRWACSTVLVGHPGMLGPPLFWDHCEQKAWENPFVRMDWAVFFLDLFTDLGRIRYLNHPLAVWVAGVEGGTLLFWRSNHPGLWDQIRPFAARVTGYVRRCKTRIVLFACWWGFHSKRTFGSVSQVYDQGFGQDGPDPKIAMWVKTQKCVAQPVDNAKESAFFLFLCWGDSVCVCHRAQHGNVTNLSQCPTHWRERGWFPVSRRRSRSLGIQGKRDSRLCRTWSPWCAHWKSQSILLKMSEFNTLNGHFFTAVHARLLQTFENAAATNRHLCGFFVWFQTSSSVLLLMALCADHLSDQVGPNSCLNSLPQETELGLMCF